MDPEGLVFRDYRKLSTSQRCRLEGHPGSLTRLEQDGKGS